jgi:hypothetical protein
MSSVTYGVYDLRARNLPKGVPTVRMFPCKIEWMEMKRQPLLTGKGCKADVDGEVIDGAEPLPEEQLPRYDGMSPPSH